MATKKNSNAKKPKQSKEKVKKPKIKLRKDARRNAAKG